MNTEIAENRMFLNRELKQDDVYTEVKIVSLAELTKLEVRAGRENAVISGNKLVNVVSRQYGLLPNQRFFLEVESKLRDADIKTVKRSINRNDCSFKVDYILSDDRYHIDVKQPGDVIVPMISFTNSYDGSCKTLGNFGFWRKACDNGLHVAHSKIGFGIRHRGNMVDLVLPHIDQSIENFLDNEFYSLHRKFEVLAEKPIVDISEFVKLVCKKTEVFKYATSEKNPEPGMNARLVIGQISREAHNLHEGPTAWHGYNSFNSLLHGKLKKNFSQQRTMDIKLFNTILELN